MTASAAPNPAPPIALTAPARDAIPDREPPVPTRALTALVLGLIGLAASNGLVQVAVAYRAQLELVVQGRRPASLEPLEHHLAETKDAAEAEKLRGRISEMVQRFEQQRLQAQRELATAEVDGAGTRYTAAWLAAVARVIVLLGAYGITRSSVRHHQIAGLAMLALFVYALTSDIKLAVG